MSGYRFSAGALREEDVTRCKECGHVLCPTCGKHTMIISGGDRGDGWKRERHTCEHGCGRFTLYLRKDGAR